MLRWFPLVLAGCGGSGEGKKAALPTPPPPQADAAVAEVPATQHDRGRSVTPDQLAWEPLGETGAMFAQAFGETGTQNGMFIKLPAGNPGALHTHAGDYHGVVVAGSPTNAQDGQKKPVALAPQSYWYQPGGVAHTTSCAKGAECIIYTHWPHRFDFQPAQPAKAAKVDPRYVERRAKDLKWQPVDAKNPKSPQLAALWGDPQSQPNGMLMRIPAGNETLWHIHKHDYHGVVLAGTVHNFESGTEPKDLPPGSYWWQPGGFKHTTNCKAGADCIVYVHFEGKYDVIPQ